MCFALASDGQERKKLAVSVQIKVMYNKVDPQSQSSRACSFQVT